MFKTPLILLALLACAFSCGAAEPAATVTELAVTTRIVKGQPVDSVRRMSSSSPRTLYCFTRISKPDEAETVIRHVWYRDGEKVGDSELPVRGTRWRTFSKKQIPAGSAGNWKVEVVDASGTVLKAREFTIN